MRSIGQELCFNGIASSGYVYAAIQVGIELSATVNIYQFTKDKLNKSL